MGILNLALRSGPAPEQALWCSRSYRGAGRAFSSRSTNITRWLKPHLPQAQAVTSLDDGVDRPRAVRLGQAWLSENVPTGHFWGIGLPNDSDPAIRLVWEDDQEQFHRSEAHWTYVDQAVEAADGRAPRAVFRARELDLGLPKVGDLVCLDRTGGRFRSTEDKRQAPGEAPLHCDVVVKVDPRRSLVATIGGNVVQSVTMALVNVHPARKGKPARLQMRGDEPGARPYFTVLELVTGGEASLDKAPSIRRIAGR